MMSPNVQVTLDRDVNEFRALVGSFLATWLTEDRRHLAVRMHPISSSLQALVPRGWEVEASLQTDYGAELVASSRDASAWISTSSSLTHLRVTARTPGLLESTLEDIEGRIEPIEQSTSLRIRVRSANTHRERHIAAPAWPEIEPFYPLHVAARLARLMQARGPTAHGRLVLWHGPPGTGKTTAIRALLREWSDWCDGVYVTDPEVLFENADYLVDLLTSSGDRAVAPTLCTPARVESRWRIVIAEDSDEFLRSSARRDAGAALGRLLNVTDGLLGDNLSVLVLLTTNEEVNRLHPALVRPGRCLAAVEFTPFPRHEAARWLGRPVAAAMTLAELLAERGDLESGNDGGGYHVGLGAYL